ncbi:hypothetical protein [Actinophytocola algeriensis]|uniref:MmyB-like transcription regulator ligand binding domain-containing protein n=1 Tax=Actinophytocola algeriensis TaxID=1768010 RepID=A0A7W7QA14_9PSEU|nr:hypothetical protein [Actinophytocola algeriensis]MBB4909618.1 hypothetical protein [Actinophytocola algeriensis]MBE1475608.1 hypothetical protein [Actinophytocola algeriensis]
MASRVAIIGRARLTPADVGLDDFGERRRVPGLRREELAPHLDVTDRPDWARLVFLDPRVRALFADWRRKARDNVADLLILPDDGQRLAVFYAEPGSPSAAALARLTSA